MIIMKKLIVLGIIVIVVVAGVFYYRSIWSMQQSSSVGQNSAVKDTQKTNQDTVNTATAQPVNPWESAQDTPQ